jgi:hypothetical protein
VHLKNNVISSLIHYHIAIHFIDAYESHTHALKVPSSGGEAFLKGLRSRREHVEEVLHQSDAQDMMMMFGIGREDAGKPQKD